MPTCLTCNILRCSRALFPQEIKYTKMPQIDSLFTASGQQHSHELSHSRRPLGSIKGRKDKLTLSGFLQPVRD